MNRRQWLFAGAAAGISLAAKERAGAAPTWVDRGSFGPFNCSATFPLAPLTPVFRQVANIERDLHRTLGLPAVTSPIDVVLLADEQSHRETLSQVYPSVPYRRALYVQRGQRGAVYAYYHDELATDLRHECTHALLHANLAMVPLWLDEGIAEYFEPPEHRRAFQNGHLPRLRWDLRFGMTRSVEQLERVNDLNNMGGLEYRSSWAWVHFMLHGPAAAHAELVRFVTDIRRGEPPGKLSARLRSAIPDLEKKLVLHFKRWRIA